MSTSNTCLTIRGIEVEVDYKDIKNLHIGVYPPQGRVRVAAPSRLSDEHVRLAVIQRLPWIKRQRQQLRDAARQSVREMVTGESHYAWGVRYRLRVIEKSGPAMIDLDGVRLVLQVPPDADALTRTRALERWRRQELRQKLTDLIVQWEPIIGRSVPHWSIRKMKTRWGSCNSETGRIWFNLELAKKHPLCVEYIVVHEMSHLIERRHNAQFVALMDKFLPDWHARRDELNSASLGHEVWRY